MKKFIKVICVILALIVTVLPLASCSEAELGYLDMLTKMLENGGNMESEQTMVIDINDMLEAELYASLFGDSLAPEDYPENITVKMTGKENIDGLISDYDAVVSFGELASVSFKYIVENSTIYMGDFSVEYDKELFDPATIDITENEELFLAVNALSVLEGADYMYLSPYEMTADMSADDMYATDAESDPAVVMSQQLTTLVYDNMSENYGILMDLVKNMFSGYSTGVVTKIDNGYKISADITDMMQMLVSLIDYMMNNPDVLMESTAVFFDGMADLAENSGNDELQVYLLAMADEMRNSIGMFDSQEEFDTTEIFTPETIEEISRMLKGTSYEAETTEKDGVYTQKVKIEIVAEGIILATVEADSITKPCEAFELTDISDASMISMIDVFERAYSYSTVAEYSPIEEMRITWDGVEGTSEVYGTLLYDETGEEYALGLYDFHNIDGSMYLPMRRICERFGEVVDWDAVNGKAYVVRGEEKIDMTGIIIGDRTFIKIRDFEKLGYIVDYQVDESGRPWAILNALPSIEAQLADELSFDDATVA
ncbi:MAG: hypothetical protein IJ391_05670 [Clostridia bacterium]|nr:hypothetical protein [Clostridia bacterium]